MQPQYSCGFPPIHEREYNRIVLDHLHNTPIPMCTSTFVQRLDLQGVFLCV
jgi:hypothetical protein